MNLDYCDWLTPERLAREDELWGQRWRDDPEWRQIRLLPVLAQLPRVTTVIEYGCSVGYIPQYLPAWVEYVGVDKHGPSLEIARQRNPGGTREFILGDIRDECVRRIDGERTLVLCFDTLKHFSTLEFHSVVQGILRHADVAYFNVAIGPMPHDDADAEFTHAWESMDSVSTAVSLTDHVIREARTAWRDGRRSEMYFLTERV